MGGIKSKMGFSNFKIERKLSVAFGNVITLMLILAVLSGLTVKNIDDRYKEMQNQVLNGLTLSEETEIALARMRQHVIYIAYNSDDLQAAQASYDAFNNEMNAAIGKMKQVLTLLDNESDKLEGKSEIYALATAIVKGIDSDYRTIGDQIYAAVKEGRILDTKEILTDGLQSVEDVDYQVSNLIESTKAAKNDMQKSVSQDADIAMKILFVIAGLNFLFSILTSGYCSRAIRKPILLLSDAVKEISKGNLNASIRSNTKDEVGELSNDIADVVDVFKKLVFEINKTTHEMNSGDIDSRIDKTKFHGDYKNVAEAINQSFESLTGDMLNIIDSIKEFAVGNFEVETKTYPGKKVVISKNLNLLQINLRSITQDINKLIKSASNGNLDIKIDAENYKGDWFYIGKGLNNLIESVRSPITEVAEVLEEVAKANFNCSIKGNYSGQFEVMKNSVNKTVQNTSEYINDISDILLHISQHDLDVHITKDYVGDFKNIKKALVQITDEFNKLFNTFNASAEQVASGAQQLSNAGMSLAQGAANQSNSVQELSMTSGKISEQTSDNAINAGRANDITLETQKFGLHGKQEMETMLASMSELEAASLNISKIIKVIEDIAFQTNLLALNASVEAARAGVHGKGFSIVAEEVRSLAARSQNATVETSELINKTISIVSNSIKVANNTAGSINEMINKVADIASIINRVSVSSKEQESGITKINQSISQISEISQANTATSEESSALAEELLSQAETFKNSLSQFKLRTV